MVLFAQAAGIGVKHSGRYLEFRVGPADRVGIHGFLPQKLVGRVVPYPRNSGNIVF